MSRLTSTQKTAAQLICVLVTVLIFAATAHAQLELGEYWKMTMNGSIGYGFNGAFGNADTQSTHGQGMNGSAELKGYYFHPNFLSFTLHPYYDRTQGNSESQTISRNTGLGAGLNLFGGSRFPGSITFSKDFSANSEFRVAGVPTVSADASSRSFGINWSALVPDYPTLTASYSTSSSDASVLDSRSQSSSRMFNLGSGYQWAGFDLRANFNHNNGSSTFPDLLVADTNSHESSSTQYGVSASHRLPLRGSLGLSWNHFGAEANSNSEWSGNSYTATNYFMPWHRLTLFQNATYVTDLSATVGQTLLDGNGTPTSLKIESGSEGVSYGNGASLSIGHGVNVGGQFNHRVQWFAGRRFEDSQYGGNITFNHVSRLFGFLYFGVGIIDTASKFGNDGAGINFNVGMTRKLHGWDTSADFNYIHNLQTLVTITNTSSYAYGFSARRKISQDFHVGGAFRESHSGLVTQEGNGNRAESFSGSVRLRRFNFASSYSQSKGTAVLTSTGVLTATPVGSLITNDFLLFNARSFSVSASTDLFRRVSIMAGYSRFNSSTTQLAVGKFVEGDRYNFRTEYRLRKFSFIGGFNRSMQDASNIAGGARLVNSYYFSLSRWFNVF